MVGVPVQTGTRTRASRATSEAASSCRVSVSVGAARTTASRPGPISRATVPRGRWTMPRRSGFSLSRLQVSMPSSAGSSCVTVSITSCAAHQGEHREADADGQAIAGAAGGDGGIHLGLQAADPAALGRQHRRHVVGDALAMDPARRRQGAVQLRPLRQEFRMCLQEGDHRVRRGRARLRHRLGTGAGERRAHRILWPVLRQSARKAARPLSVSGCLSS